MTSHEINSRIASRFKSQRHHQTERMARWPVESWEVSIASTSFWHWYNQRHCSLSARARARGIVGHLRHLKSAT